MRLTRATVLAALALAAASCKDSTAPPVPSALVIQAQPSASAQSGAAFAQQPTIQLQDANGKPVSTGGLQVSVALATGGAALGGTLVATTSSSGVATFTGLEVTGVVGVRTLRFTSGNLAPATSQAISISAGPATKLALATQPATAAQSGVALTAQPVVQVQDQSGNAVAQPGTVVTASTVSGTGAPASATATTNAAGMATFSGLALSGTTGTYTFRFTATGLTQVDAAAATTVGAGPAAKLVLTSQPATTAQGGVALTAQPVVQLQDQSGNPVAQAGTVVTASTVNGTGTITSATATTNASGAATFSGLTLSGTSGSYTFRFTAPSLQQVDAAAATALSAGPGGVVAFVGDNQHGLDGYAVNIRPAVRVTDSDGAAVPGQGVTFAVASGGGSVTSATVNTNANGVAQVGSWVLGASAGTNTLTATATGSGIAGNPVTFTATGQAAAFNITIQNIGPAFSTGVQAAFDAAVAKWQQVIYQDIPDVTNFSVSAGQCGANPAIGPTTVDDVLILAQFDSIDGPGAVLGAAGPCIIRSSGQTVVGHMVFDTADVANLIANGSLNSVILHEMGHVLGFGTLWSQLQFNCLQGASSAGNPLDTYFSCPKAVAMFDSIGGTSYTGGNKVPVENCGPASPAGCSAGTINSHWREPVLDNELMTGYLNHGVNNPLSRLTAAAMEDLGYGVNDAGSDDYVHTFTLQAGVANLLGVSGGNGVLSLGDDVYHGPIYVVDTGGRLVRVIRLR